VDRLQDRRVLVLGATGFIGRWTVAQLRQAGAQVWAHARSPDAPRPRPLAQGVHLEVADLSQPGSCGELIHRVRPDMVFNLAAYGVARQERDPSLHQRINQDVMEELICGVMSIPSEWTGCRVLHLGSALEYGKAADSLDEEASCVPDTLYGRSKLAATEQLWEARDGGLASLVIRPFTVFGLGERPGRLVPTLLEAMNTSHRVPLSAGTQRRDFLYVEEVVRAALALACVPEGPVLRRARPFDAPALNVASGNLLPVREFVRILADELNIGAERLGFGDVAQDEREMHHPAVPTGRCGEALGGSLDVEIRDGVARLKARLAEGHEAVGMRPTGADDGEI